MLHSAHILLGFLHIHIRILKKSHLKLQSQYTGNSLINEFLTHLSLGYRITQITIGTAIEIHVDTGTQCRYSSILIGRNDVVRTAKSVDTQQVGDRKAPEFPFTMQQVLKQIAIGCTGHTVDGIIGTHD